MTSEYISEAGTTFQADKEQITKWLSHFTYPVEVRIPDTRRKTLSGYYTPDQFHQLAKDLEFVLGNPGTYGKVDAVYCTLNEFPRSLIARSCNHISPYAKDTTADHAIVRRHWLPLDVDADKPKGVCSSDEQKALAKECVAELETYLSSVGFPEPLKGDSGNGWHLLYRLDFPSNDETTATIKAFYNALHRRFGEAWTGRAKLDTTVYNPARIWKLYGTPVQKGDQVPEIGIRHRMARLLSVPDALFPVPLELLRTASGTPTTPSGGNGNGNGKIPDFLAGETIDPEDTEDKAEPSKRRWDEWLKAHEVEARGDWRSFKDGYKVDVAWCPNCGETDKSHVLIVHGSGAVDYRCLHERCKDYRWRQYRIHYEPDAYEKKATDTSCIQDVIDAEKGLPPATPSENSVKPEQKIKEQEDKSKPKRKKPVPQAERLLALSADLELWHGTDAQAYATTEGHNMTVGSAEFRRWLVSAYFKQFRSAPSPSAIQSALLLIECKAHEGAEHSVHLRVANTGDTIYLDLGRQFVVVTKDGWETASDVPVKFRRTRNMAALPVPVRGGSVDELRRLTTLSDRDFALVKGWLLCALRGLAPYLVLALAGEQGSAKSTLCEILRNIVDPLKLAALSGPPREEKDLAADGKQSHVLAYDNVSFIPQWLSDALCRVSTGGGLKARQLYTDGEQYVVDLRNPIVLNGIPDAATSQDLVSRAVILSPPVIPEDKRLAKSEIDSRLAEALPRVLGALLDLLSAGLRNTHLNPQNLPRMADCALWVTRCTGSEEWLDVYTENIRQAMEIGLESSPVFAGVRQLLDGHLQCEFTKERKGVDRWQGTAAELLKVLQDLPAFLAWDAKHRPDTPRALTNALKRDATAMRQQGIDVTHGRSNGKRIVTIERQ